MYFSLGWPKTLCGASVDGGPILLLKRHPLKHLVFALTSEALLVWHARVRLSFFVYACVCVSVCVPIFCCLKCSPCTYSSTCWWDALSWLTWEKEGCLQILLFDMTEVEWQSAWVCVPAVTWADLSIYFSGYQYKREHKCTHIFACGHACECTVQADPGSTWTTKLTAVLFLLVCSWARACGDIFGPP